MIAGDAFAFGHGLISSDSRASVCPRSKMDASDRRTKRVLAMGSVRIRTPQAHYHNITRAAATGPRWCYHLFLRAPGRIQNAGRHEDTKTGRRGVRIRTCKRCTHNNDQAERLPGGRAFSDSGRAREARANPANPARQSIGPSANDQGRGRAIQQEIGEPVTTHGSTS